ncbi:hypothetical protein DQ04_04481050 [Trypanosoma grayi]|uniref:hypothetical protein n=1 Tax=Trypanosoma grayi TaxID=71804 RepID=UPI0004F4570B|nr:hypothetical protein DQ04_04481050 [Trypanosoma grayi]KEG09895.1 hypothetical protein DQ04_04481050 [Trypanosoma grayi]
MDPQGEVQQQQQLQQPDEEEEEELQVPPPPPQQVLPFVLRAPVHKATFFSLTLVEELLRHARKVDQECPLLVLPLSQSRESTRVLSRIQRETRYEEYWPVEHPVAGDECRGAPSALYLLRIGLLRALGFPTPGVGDATDTAALVLGRDVVTSASSVDGAPASPLLYREAAQEELRRMALGEWCEDLLFFTVHRGFSAVQVRCVLLTAMHLMNTVADLPANATDEAAEDCCAKVLEKLLIEQACGLPNKIVETRQVVQMTTVEVPDLQYVATIEAKLAKEKNKKQQQALRDQLANAPTCSETRREVHEEKVMTEIVVGPYFTLHEVAQILDYLSSSVVRHWRLFRSLLSEPQPVEMHEEVQEQWDAWAFCIPPLTEFLPDDVHMMELGRQDLMHACEVAIDEAFEEEFMRPLRELQRQRNDLLECLQQQELQAEEDNRRNALDGVEYMRVAHAFTLRLGKRIERNDTVMGHAESDEMPLSSLPEVTGTSTPRKSTSVSAGSHRRGGSKGCNSSATAVPLQCIQLPADTCFSLDDVEARVTKLEAAAQAMVDSLLEKPKKKRG